MKRLEIKYAIALMLIPLALSSCFSDDGNYEYESLQPPTWLINIEKEAIWISGRGGQDITIDASKAFNWGNQDSLKRNEEVRYEWTYKGRVICDKLKETVPAEELMKRMGITEYMSAETYLSGDFSIIEKKSGVTFKARTTIQIKAPITGGDFIIYSNKEGQPSVGTLSVLGLNYIKGTSLTKNYSFQKAFSEDIPGTPKELDIAMAMNVSATGSITAITKEGDASVFNASTLKKEWDLSSQFADGTPQNFLVSARRDQETSGTHPAFTWVATQDGRVFTRQTGKNWLGGKFLSEPYYLDEKGYKITKFGHTLWGITNIPCYDEKNRRVVIATSLPHNETNTYRSFMKALTSSDWNPAYTPVMNMPEDTKVYYMSGMNSVPFSDNNHSWYQIYFTTGGKSIVGTFTVDVYNRNLGAPQLAYTWPYEIPDHLFNDETVFLTAATNRFRYPYTYNQYDFFSEGTKVFGIKKVLSPWSYTVSVQEMPFEGITSKITSMIYDRSSSYWGGGYMHLVIGCENGDVLVYLTTTLQAPRLVEKYNVGGRVASIKQLGLSFPSLDMY
ncbi:PKD-like family lipoprotein [Prevotella sp. KH2C16]|uniref:PKD-like family lipoprotein n=1 Tax=Prevotella sp. KH2C16 TaxID=1855325 RepID=UPI0008EEEBAE|nr:PKD-like family lipoprotein [Prevotella sp. KH2C16]SFF87931.1 PKD-like family protein [Prevotella sp. KH2C16]